MKSHDKGNGNAKVGKPGSSDSGIPPPAKSQPAEKPVGAFLAICLLLISN